MYFSYWGKASPQNDLPYHLLAYHSLDVAAVGYNLLNTKHPLTQDIASFLDLPISQFNTLLTFMLALHDLGKFASAFQTLYTLPTPALFQQPSRYDYDSSSYRHDRLGLYFWQKIAPHFFNHYYSVSKKDVSYRPLYNSLQILMNCVLGHHGQPIDYAFDITRAESYTRPHNLQAAQQFFDAVFTLFSPCLPIEKFCDNNWRLRLKQVSWPLAGIAVLADWVGSNQQFFPYQHQPMPLSEYWVLAQQKAQQALAATELNQFPIVNPFISVTHHFGFQYPTPLQHWAEEVVIDNSPQLFILEDVTGAGKTEAALTLTHRLMAAGAAEGFYFGLPTMATSNAMFERIQQHYQQMFVAVNGLAPSIVLAHGAREMNSRFQHMMASTQIAETPYSTQDQTISAQCNQWLADSRKKALLAPVGVGTLDQALLAVLPRRHQSLRLLGLNRKVLIFDEVHSADSYMLELLMALLALHLHQGGSVILLTATLSQQQRQQLISAWLQAAHQEEYRLTHSDFPLATHCRLQANHPVQEYPLAPYKATQRHVQVVFLHSVSLCLQTILTAVNQGHCVVWIRNTVNDALAAYQLVQAQVAASNCLLFHSRFILRDRQIIENQVLNFFGKNSTHTKRQGKVLIATQVFQESLDVDCDVMISDICPIDDLIQRTGRLHRHCRDHNGRYHQGQEFRSAPIVYLHAPQWTKQPTVTWLSENFQGTQAVYRSPGRLWLGMKILRSLGAIRLPAEARQLVEAVYGEAADANIPKNLVSADHQLIGDQRAKASAATAQILAIAEGYSHRSSRFWTEDHMDISTRYSNIEIAKVLLLRQSDSGDYHPWVTDESFAIPLSTLSLPKAQYADKLTLLNEEQTQIVHRRYPNTFYLLLWLPEQDPTFCYHQHIGFSTQI